MRSVGGSFSPPLPTTDDTIKTGARYAPHGACLPMKTVLGNFLESYENGADTAFFLGGTGPCCFGYFAESFRLIFKNNGISMDVISPEYDISGIRKIKKMMDACATAGAGKQAFYALPAVSCAFVLDRYEQAAYDKRAEITSEEKKLRLDDFEKEKQMLFHSSRSLIELKRMAAQALSELNDMESERIPELKIGIVGDIYTVIDPFMNKNIQKTLSNMGAYTRRSMSISGWLGDKLKLKRNEAEADAKEFLPDKTGGFATETVGSAAKWQKEGFDGIIELYPLNCMPESVARNILPGVSKKYGKPVLSIVMDEQSGEAGFLTRLEAFTQMIMRRKEA